MGDELHGLQSANAKRYLGLSFRPQGWTWAGLSVELRSEIGQHPLNKDLNAKPHGRIEV
jgi:hypothetical protein